MKIFYKKVAILNYHNIKIKEKYEKYYNLIYFFNILIIIIFSYNSIFIWTFLSYIVHNILLSRGTRSIPINISVINRYFIRSNWYSMRII